MASPSPGLLIIALGVAIVLIGFLVWLGAFSWFGHLPGDIKIDRGSTKIFIPIGSMVVLTVILNVVLYLVRRFL
jgi:hypothetical protein